MRAYEFGRGIWLVLLLATVSGCVAYAPPVRITHTGAPGRLPAKNVKVNLSISEALPAPPTGINGDASYGISERGSVESGLNAAIKDSLVHYAGVRFVPWPLGKQSTAVKLALDLAVGGGLGVGGTYGQEGPGCENPDDEGASPLWIEPDSCVRFNGRHWHERLAGGAYGEIGLGMSSGGFDMFVRGMYQLTRASEIPLTHWLSLFWGIQYTGDAGVGFQLGAGAFKYFNELDTYQWFFTELGLSYTFPVVSR